MFIKHAWRPAWDPCDWRRTRHTHDSGMGPLWLEEEPPRWYSSFPGLLIMTHDLVLHAAMQEISLSVRGDGWFNLCPLIPPRTHMWKHMGHMCGPTGHISRIIPHIYIEIIPDMHVDLYQPYSRIIPHILCMENYTTHNTGRIIPDTHVELGQTYSRIIPRIHVELYHTNI